MNILAQINRIERLDQLIRMKATGKPEQVAKRLNVSRSTIYNLLDFIKNQGVDIYYSSSHESFCYKKEVYFYFGFSIEKVNLRKVNGGTRKYNYEYFEKSKYFGLE